MQYLWSAVDEIAGHRCRYSTKMLTNELADNGWQLINFTHYQFLLFPLFIVSRLLGDN